MSTSAKTILTETTCHSPLPEIEFKGKNKIKMVVVSLRIHNCPIKLVITSVEVGERRDKVFSWEDSIESRWVWDCRFNFRELQVRRLMSSSLYRILPVTRLPHIWGPSNELEVKLLQPLLLRIIQRVLDIFINHSVKTPPSGYNHIYANKWLVCVTYFEPHWISLYVQFICRALEAYLKQYSTSISTGLSNDNESLGQKHF